MWLGGYAGFSFPKVRRRGEGGGGTGLLMTRQVGEPLQTFSPVHWPHPTPHRSESVPGVWSEPSDSIRQEKGFRHVMESWVGDEKNPSPLQQGDYIIWDSLKRTSQLSEFE